jgi:tetratricopeptide (TPR) repeat protein
MKVSQQNRSPWVYVVLVLMLLTLLGFFLFPLLNSIIQQNQSSEGTGKSRIGDLPSETQVKLEAEEFGYKLVLEREPENQTALRGLLQVRLQRQDIQGAIEPLEKLALLNPDLVEYQILLAQAKQQINDIEGATEVYQTILDSHPALLQALTGIVDLLLQQNLAQKAIDLLQNTLETETQTNLTQSDTADITSVQLLLAQVYIEEKRYFDAIAIYDQAISTNNSDFRPVLSKALVLQEQGKNSEAEPLFNQALELAPTGFKDQIKSMTTSTNNNDQ